MADQGADQGDVRVRRTIRFGFGPDWSPEQMALALISCVGVALFVTSLRLAVDAPIGIWWWAVLAPLTLIGYAGSAAPLGLWGVLLYAWYVNAPAGSFTAWSVPAALGVAVAHTSTALLAAGPPGATLPRALVVHSLRGLLVAVGAAAAVGLLTTAAGDATLEAGPAAYVIGLLGLGLGVLWLRSAPVEPPD